MNCPENEYVCSVKRENNLGYYRLHTIWKSCGFFINITSRDGAWRGEMTESDVRDMSSQLEINPETYLQQCKEALTLHDGKPGIVYAVENGMFTWKKVVDEDSGIKIKMGSVMLEPASFVNTIQNLVDLALNCNKKLQNEVKVLTQEKEKYMASKNELINKLNELVKTKEQMEDHLYKRFLLLLNTKKKKIFELENALEDKSKKSKTAVAKQSLGDPYELDTEEEENALDDKTERSKTIVAEQNLEDPYELDTEEEEDFFQKETSPRKRKPVIKQSLFQGEAPEQKKAKNIEEKISHISIREPDFVENDFSQPGPSKVVSKTLNTEIPSTKDELLDYFYGSS